ncbi:MAG: glycosyltransferase [Candidatus Omnitrophica bacterium]|nr:glycosyltransferase [Candidatus Omnitrophota bacterium]
MKILHVIPSYLPAYRYGGPVKAVHELCRGLVNKGLDISVYTTNRDFGVRQLEVPINRVVDIDQVKVTYYSTRFIRKYYYSKTLSKSLQESIHTFDLLHVHSVFVYPTLIASRLCQKSNKPYIINPLGALDPSMIKLKSGFKKMLYINLVERYNIERAAVIHVASVYEEKRLFFLGFKTPVAIIPRGIDLNDYSGNDINWLEERYPQLKDKKKILFLGRVTYKKGFILLAQAFEMVLRNHDAYLIIAGPSDGNYIDKVRQMFAKAGLSRNVIFTGMLLDKEKFSVLYSSDIFVLPSYGENFGIAVLEAMACKLPVVITDQVGLYPDVEEYKAGIIASCNPLKIANAILQLLNNEDMRKAMGENGRKLVEDRFTSDKIADSMANLYEKILNK